MFSISLCQHSSTHLNAVTLSSSSLTALQHFGHVVYGLKSIVQLRLILDLNISLAPPVKFSAIPEEMRTKSIEAGCPIVLQCVVSDPEAHVCWYKDEMQLNSHSGLETISEGNTRTLVVQCAEVCHSGVYRCTTQDDTMEFQVEIKGDFTLFILCVFNPLLGANNNPSFHFF